jgi:hypothetical protein
VLQTPVRDLEAGIDQDDIGHGEKVAQRPVIHEHDKVLGGPFSGLLSASVPEPERLADPP